MYVLARDRLSERHAQRAAFSTWCSGCMHSHWCWPTPRESFLAASPGSSVVGELEQVELAIASATASLDGGHSHVGVRSRRVCGGWVRAPGLRLAGTVSGLGGWAALAAAACICPGGWRLGGRPALAWADVGTSGSAFGATAARRRAISARRVAMSRRARASSSSPGSPIVVCCASPEPVCCASPEPSGPLSLGVCLASAGGSVVPAWDSSPPPSASFRPVSSTVSSYASQRIKASSRACASLRAVSAVGSRSPLGRMKRFRPRLLEHDGHSVTVEVGELVAAPDPGELRCRDVRLRWRMVAHGWCSFGLTASGAAAGGRSLLALLAREVQPLTCRNARAGCQRERTAQATQVRACGMASSRSSGMAVPHDSHDP